MPKKRIRGVRGKQMFTNNLFNKGMVFTSSEMPAGYNKMSVNLDVAPTGDLASPRNPYIVTKYPVANNYNKYTYPVKFASYMGAKKDTIHYISFNRTISEKDFVNDILYDNTLDTGLDPIGIYSRKFNDNIIEGKTAEGVYDPTYQPVTNVEFIPAGVKPIARYAVNTYIYDFLFGVSDKGNHYGFDEIEVIDADTVKIIKTGERIRLVTINAPEKNEKWFEYGKRYLINLLESIKTSFWKDTQSSAQHPNILIVPTGDVDIYGRSISYMYIEVYDKLFTSTESYYGYIYVNEPLVREGLVKIDFVFDKYSHIKKLATHQSEAIGDKRRIWNVTEDDPLYKETKNTITLPSNTTVDVVKLLDDSTSSGNVIRRVDDVQHIYVDYLDAIGFIGRLVTLDTNMILYKGIMFIRPTEVSGKFELYLPPNNYQGTIPPFVESSVTGYNLYNTDIVDTTDSNNKFQHTAINGIAITERNNPRVIVTQAVPGMEVMLNNIINKSYMNFETNDKFFINADVKFVSSVVDPDKPSIPIYKEDSIKFNNYLTDRLSMIYTSGKESVNIGITSVTLLDATNGPIKDVNGKEIKSTIDPKIPFAAIYHDSVIGSDIINQNIYGQNYNLTVKLTDLTRSAGLITSFAIEIIVTLLDSTTVERVVKSKWEVAKFGDEKYTTLFEKVTYTLDNYDNIIAVTGVSDDIPYTIPSYNNLIFRFSLIPTTRTLYNDTDYFYNDDIALTQVFAAPALKVGDEISTLSTESLTRNLNIKDATRLCVFNRQIGLYGPHTITNTIFFSMFEREWYYNYPYYAIDVPEPINSTIVYNGQLVIFGTDNIYMLSTQGSVNESTINRIYDGVSVSTSDIGLVGTVGSNLIFFNNNMGYITTTNKYYDDPTKITIYKLTEAIHNCLVNPEYIIRVCNKIPISSVILSITAESKMYVDIAYMNLIYNYSYIINDVRHTCTIIYRYNQTYRYWTIYHIPDVITKHIISPYLFESTYGIRYAVLDGNGNFNDMYMSHQGESKIDIGINDTKTIEVIIDSGFLSVDAQNEKRFKSLIFDFNNIASKESLITECIFFVDGKPINMGYDTSAVLVDNYGSEKDITSSGYPEGDNVFVHISNVGEDQYYYGKRFTISNTDWTYSGRSNLTLPVFGMGRLPSFVIRITAEHKYELLSYSIIYKEKDINTRR